MFTGSKSHKDERYRYILRLFSSVENYNVKQRIIKYFFPFICSRSSSLSCKVCFIQMIASMPGKLGRMSFTSIHMRQVEVDYCSGTANLPISYKQTSTCLHGFGCWCDRCCPWLSCDFFFTLALFRHLLCSAFYALYTRDWVHLYQVNLVPGTFGSRFDGPSL